MRGIVRRTALVVALSLVVGLLGATGLTRLLPAVAAVSVTQVSNWKLDAGTGTTAADSVGTKTATLNSGATWTPGLRGASSLAMNGTSGAATTSGAVLNTTNSFSVSAYVKLNNLTGGQAFVSQDGSSASGFYLQLRSDSHKFGFTRLSVDGLTGSGTTGVNAVATADDAPVVGQWYHVAGVYDSVADTISLYVNGRLQQTVAAPDAWSATGSFVIGRGKYNGASTFFLNGTIDEVRAYSGALTADDVEQIADSAWYKLNEGSGTTAVDAGLTQGNGTLVNGPTYGPGPSGTALTFDGTNDHVDANRSTFDTSKSFAVSAWARTTQLTAAKVVASADGTNYSGFSLYINGAGKWGFSRASSDVASPTLTSVLSTATATIGTWYHLVGVYDSVAGTLTLYVDGVAQGSPVSYTTGWRASGDFIVGRNLVSGAAANYFSGAVDEVHTYPFAIDDQMAAQLADPTPPPSPATPTATLSGTTVTVSWVAPAPISGSPTTGYVITPYANGVAGSPVSTTGSATSQTFTGAAAGVSYRYTVAAVNANGTSSTSAQSTAVTYNVPGAPTITATTASGSTTASLTWSAPSSNGGSAITGYRVTPYIGSTAQTTQTFAASSAGTAQSVTGLTPGTTYTFRVAAQNAYGYGADSAASGAVTTSTARPATMAAPTATAGLASASVSWVAPAANGSAITGYVVTPYVGTTAQTAQSFSSTATTQQLTGLTAGTAYTFTVSAVNAVGTGTASPASTAVTPYALPGAPTVTAVTAAAQGATLTWNAPASNGGSAITGYRVTPYLAGVAQTPVTFASGAAGSAQTVGGLTAGKSYTFTVAARNAGGYGAESAASAAVTPTAAGPTSPPPQATQGGSFSYQFSTTGLTAPITYAVSDGTLPPGLTLSTGGLLSGTPTAAGTFVWTVRVTDANGVSSRTVTQVVAAPPVVTFTPAAGVVGTAYSAQPTVAGGTGPFVWTVPTGSLPGGMTMSTTTGLVSGTPTAAGSYPVTVQASDANSVLATRAVTFVVTDKPGTVATPTATAGLTSAVLTWTAPSTNGSTITAYVITPYISGTAQPSVTVDPSAKTRTLNGLTAGTSYTFRVAAVNANGTGTASAASNAVTPFAALSAPVVTATTAGDGQATLSWTAPSSTGGVPITGYVVTPYIGATAQTPTTFTTNATTQTVTGLTPGTAYTFKVAATNSSGSTVLYRVNAGGSQLAATDGGPSWTDDSDNSVVTYRNTGSDWTNPGTVDRVDGTVPASTPTAVFATNRYDFPGGDEMMWSFPATSGTTAVVRLYFANTYAGTSSAGSRVFDVALEGTTVLPGFDIITAAGGSQAGTMREFAVTSDGTVNIDFRHGAAENPQVNGIEIIQTGTAATGPASSSSTAVTPNANPTLTFAAPPVARVGVAYSYQLPVTGGTAPFTWTVSGGTLPAGISLSSGGLLSGTPTAVGSSTFTAKVTDASGQTATRSTALVVADVPSAPATPSATAGLTSATLTWVAPAANGSPITGYVITPYLAGTAQTAITVDPSAKTRTLNGLTVGGAYTFTVAAVNAAGTGTASAASNAVTPYAALSAPTITTVTARTGSATLSWTAPTSTGGSPVTGYVVTPYLGTTAQTPTSFTTNATTQTVTGLTPGAAYTFRVAATNSSGTTVLYRVNAGGPQLAATDGGPSWSADDATDNPLRNSGSLTASDSTSVTNDTSIPATTPAGVFDTERFDPGGLGDATVDEMSWAFPVTTGTKVKVRAYFANHYYTKATVGSRVFDVKLEGATVLPGFDVIAAAGGTLRATMREFSVTSDGTVNLDFLHGTDDNPLVNAIEIVQTGTATTGPASSASTAVTPNASPTLTFSAPPAGEVGIAYSSQLPVNGGTTPFTWTVTSGTLPAGLSLSSSGLLAGSPTSAGSFTYTVQVTDASGQSASRSVTQVIAAAPSLTFTPAVGEVDVPYSQQPTLSGGTSPIAWTLTAGSLPAGVTLDATTGLVSGTPTAAGTFAVTIRATDSFNATASRSVSIVIAAAPSLSAAPPSGRQNAAYSYTFAATGGVGPFAYAVVAGSLPPGLTLSAAGVLAGAGTTQGTFPFTVRATDSNGRTASVAVSVFIDTPPIRLVKTASSTTAVPGATITYTLTATNLSSELYDGIHFYDPLSDVLDDATYNGDAAVAGGPGEAVAYDGSTLDWRIPLQGGATATLTYSVTVKSPAAGNQVLTGTVAGSFAPTSCTAGQQDSGCTTTVLVSVLTIATTAGASTTTPGGTVTFSIVVTNSGRTPYAAATFSQSLVGVLDDATYGGNATATSGSLSYSDSTLTWTGPLAVGASATISYSVTVSDPDTGNRSLTATAVSASAGSTCPSGSPGPSCSADVTVLVPALSITSTSSTTTTTPGGSVSSTLTLVNTGQTPYTGTSVTLDLRGVLDDGTPGGGTATSGNLVSDPGTGTLVWTGDLAVGATVTITVPVTVADPDAGDRTLSTVASSTAAGSTCPPGSTNPSCRTSVQVLVPALSVAASSDVTTTTPGSVVRFTVLLTNTGQTPYTGASFSTSLSGVLDDATYAGDLSATAGSASSAGSTVSWTGDLALGASATVTYSVSVHAADGGDNRLTSTVVSPTRGSTCPTGGPGPRCTVTVPVARLVLVQTATETSTTPGSVVHLSTSWTNTGQVPYVGISVVSPRAGTADDTTPNEDQTTSSGALTRTSDALTWTGDIGVGAVVTGTRSLVVKDPDPGDKLITATLRSTAPGNNCPAGTTDPRCTFAVPVLVPGLTISKVASTTTTVPGDTVSYTVTAHNTGQTSYSAAALTDSLTGVLDDADYGGDASASSGTLAYAAPNLSWTGALALDQTVTITYTVTVKAQPGDKAMVNRLSSGAVGNNCPTASADPTCRSTVVVLTPGLTIVKTADVANATLGSPVTYSVRVTNSGQTPYADASFSDSLSGVLDDATYNGDATTTPSGTVGYTGGTLTWSGALAPGAEATVTYSVTVRNPSSGDRNLTNTVVSTTTASNCPAGGSDSRCTALVEVTNAYALTITKTADVQVTAAGQKVAYTVTAVSSSALPVAGANFTDQLAGVLDDATYDADATASSGTVMLNGSTLSWVGNVAARATVTVRYSVTVNAPATGDQLLTGQVVSTSPSVSNSCLGASTDPRCASRVPVAALVIQQAYDEPTTTPGSLLHLSATFTNTGQADYFGITISSPVVGTVDDALPTGDQVATSGSLVLSATAITWTGDIPVGGSVTVTGTVTVKNPDPGDHRVTGTLVSAALGNNCPAGGSDARCTAQSVVQVPQLSLTTTADKIVAVPGERVRLTFTISDTGETAYPGLTVSDSLAGVLDDAVYGGDAVASAGALALSGPPGAEVLTWTGDLAVGQTVMVTFSVTAQQRASGDMSLISTVSSDAVGSTCPAGSGAARCWTATEILRSTLELRGLTRSFTVSGTPGSTVSLDDAVVGSVVTNSLGGYAVGVRVLAGSLTGQRTGDTIPVGNLSVRRHGSGEYTALSTSGPTPVYSQDHASASGGDVVRTDYQVEIPFVDSDTYSVTVEYVLTAQ